MNKLDPKLKLLMQIELNKLDIRYEKQERKRGYVVNVYRLGHYMIAIERIEELMQEGRTLDQAIAPDIIFSDGPVLNAIKRAIAKFNRSK